MSGKHKIDCENIFEKKVNVTSLVEMVIALGGSLWFKNRGLLLILHIF